jgi:energy-coupling factor transport system permease protein
VTATRTLNLVVLGLLVVVVAVVVWACRSPSVPAKVFGAYLKIGLVVVLFRVVLQIVFAPRVPGHVLLTLPEASLPSWMAGISLGGPITTDMLLEAIAQGARLAVLLITFGAVNALSSPSRLLRTLPAVLYEAGVTTTMALTTAPQAVLSAQQVLEARRLRGRPTRGPAGLRGLAVPVLDLAVDRSVEVAASMDARGYGRTNDEGRSNRARGIVLAAGFVSLAIGLYGLLSSAGRETWALVATVGGALGLGVAVVSAGRHDGRTRHRAIRWDRRATAIVASGLALLLALVVTSITDGAALDPIVNGLSHTLPPTLVPGLLLAMAPSVIAPTDPRLRT